MNQIIKQLCNPVVYLLILVVIGATACGSLAPSPRIQIADVVSAIKNGEVRRLTVTGNQITVTYKNGGTALAEMQKNQSFEETMATFGVTPAQLNAARITYEYPPLD